MCLAALVRTPPPLPRRRRRAPDDRRACPEWRSGLCVRLLHAATISTCYSQASAQHCPVASLESLPDLVASCCEDMPSGSCASGFPSVCPAICAASLVSFWNDCDETIVVFPDDYFEGFTVSGVREMVPSCRQVGGCTAPRIFQSLDRWISAAQDSICTAAEMRQK
eukprot:SAG31_NODE_5466_length_2523_cov_1.370875_2_plen_166_part_00